MLAKNEVLAALREGEIDLSPLTFQEITIEPGDRLCPDVALRMSWGDWSGVFVGEIINSSTPKVVEGALAQARRYATDGDLPLVVAPYLGPKTLERCLEAEVSAFDLGGNAAVVVPGRMAVFRTGAPNEYPASRDIKFIYRGKSSLVSRVLLLRPRFELVGDVLAAIQGRRGEISLGTVSKVLKGMEDDLVIRKEPAIEVLQVDRLLERLVENYRVDRVVIGRSVEVKLDMGPDSLWRLRRVCDDLGVKCVSATTGSDDPVPETGSPSIYVEKIDNVLSALDLTPVSRFGTLSLLESTDARVYFDRRDKEGFYWSSPVQRYLELAVSGKRERELSEALKKRILVGSSLAGGVVDG
jgi:hypothetical protein